MGIEDLAGVLAEGRGDFGVPSILDQGSIKFLKIESQAVGLRGGIFLKAGQHITRAERNGPTLLRVALSVYYRGNPAHLVHRVEEEWREDEAGREADTAIESRIDVDLEKENKLEEKEDAADDKEEHRDPHQVLAVEAHKKLAVAVRVAGLYHDGIEGRTQSRHPERAIRDAANHAIEMIRRFRGVESDTDGQQ